MAYVFPSLVGLLIVWQLILTAIVLKRSWTLAAELLGIFVFWYVTALWAGLFWVLPLAVTVFVESCLILLIVWFGSVRFRIRAIPFAAVGMAASLLSWATNGFVHWGSVAAILVTLATLAYSLGRKFRGASPLPIPRSDVDLYRYTYCSRRALDDVISDGGPKTSRFAVQLKELELPSFGGWGPKVSFSSAARSQGRHAATQKIEAWLTPYTFRDPLRLLSEKRGFLAGQGDVHVSMYGTNENDKEAPAARAALFLRTQVADLSIGICLFGSMDNFDGYIQDAHPQSMRGWASSATPAVMEWLRENVDWQTSRWSETVGNVACKFANYELAEPAGVSYRYVTVDSNYDMDYVMKQDDAEWCAFIYHVEQKKDYQSLPFDVVMIGRPLWVRSRHPRVRTSADHPVGAIQESPRGTAERQYREKWMRILAIRGESSEWQTALFKAVMRLRSVSLEQGERN